MPLFACNGCVKDLFVTEEEFIERFTGKMLLTWGIGNSGGLGDNTIIAKSSPVQTFSGGTNWKEIKKTSGGAAAIKTDGSLWTWGNNGSGQLGNNSVLAQSSPVQTVSNVTIWQSVSAGNSNTAGVKTDGTLWIWGIGSLGIIGNNNVLNQSSPVQTISVGTNWKSVSVGNNNAAGVKTDGTLWLWGFGGTTGTDNGANRSSPVQTISAGTNWKSVSIGSSVIAIKTDGSLWTWGTGTSGQLGNNSILSRSSPVQTVSNVTTWKQASNGYRHSAAIKTDGSLWLWGCGVCGGLGDNTLISKSSPVQTVSGGTNWRCISVGNTFNGAIKTDGSLWLWGYGSNGGGFGNNSAINRSSPVQTISAGTDWRSISLNSSINAGSSQSVGATCTA